MLIPGYILSASFSSWSVSWPIHCVYVVHFCVLNSNTRCLISANVGLQLQQLFYPAAVFCSLCFSTCQCRHPHPLLICDDLILRIHCVGLVAIHWGCRLLSMLVLSTANILHDSDWASDCRLSLLLYTHCASTWENTTNIWPAASQQLKANIMATDSTSSNAVTRGQHACPPNMLVLSPVSWAGPMCFINSVRPTTDNWSCRQLSVPSVRCSTFGSRAYSGAGPTVWDSLLGDLLWFSCQLFQEGLRKHSCSPYITQHLSARGADAFTLYKHFRTNVLNRSQQFWRLSNKYCSDKTAVYK